MLQQKSASSHIYSIFIKIIIVWHKLYEVTNMLITMVTVCYCSAVLSPQVLLVKWVNVSMLTLIQHRRRSSSCSRLVDSCWDEAPKSSEEVFHLLFSILSAENSTCRHPNQEEEAELPAETAINFSRVPPGKLFTGTLNTNPTHTHIQRISMVCEKHPQISLALSKNKLLAACEQAFELSVSARSTCTYKQVSTSPPPATPPHIDPERIINPADDSPEVEPASIHSEKLWVEHLRTDLRWFLIQFSGRMLVCEYSPPDLPSVPTICPQVRFYSWHF